MNGSSSSRIIQALRTFHQKHEQVKQFVHNSMRYPLPPAGRYFMGFVYFLIPVVGGYGVMQWAIGKAHASIGADGEYLPVKGIQGLGDKRVVVVVNDDDNDDDDGDSGAGTGKKLMTQTVGAGGWGGGVHLAVSDEDTQRKNREKLNQFLLMQKRRHEKQQEQQRQRQRQETPEEKQ